MKIDGTIIDMETGKEGNKFKRKAMKIGEIVAGSVAVTLESNDTWGTSMTVGIIRGIYTGSAKSGLKTGAVTMGVMMGINVVGNMAGNIKSIYDA